MQWRVPFSILVLFVLGECQFTAALICIECTDCPDATDIRAITCSTGCSIWKNDNGVVERGCRDGGSTNVIVIANCNAFMCNNRLVPVCQQCCSLESCEEVACDTLEAECYVNKEDDRRGCTSDGNYTNTVDFETCKSYNCNRVAHCVICSSDNGPDDANCLNDPLNFTQPCPLHGFVTDENCYRYEVSKEQFQLGCTTDPDIPEKCGVNDCYKCDADNCNQREFQTCYACDNCRTLEQDQGSPRCTDYNSTCFIAYDRGSKATTRGCSNDLDKNLYEKIVYECSEPNCNGDEFPTHRQCYQDAIEGNDYCDSLNATRCFTQDGLNRGCDTDQGFQDCKEFENCVICDSDGCNFDEPAAECVIYTNAAECTKKKCDQETFNVGCYMYHGPNGTLVKGCLNELVDEQTEEYQACTNNEESCQKCTGLYCNEMHCLSCNSRDGVECVAGEGNIQYELCPMDEDKCRMFVDDEGHTVRGCSSKFEDRICDDKCQENGEPASNDELFPKDAMKCYQCTEDCDVVDREQLNYCSRNNVSGCYYKIDGSDTTSRGCLSEEGLDCGNACNTCTEDKYKCNNNDICATLCSDGMCNEICSSNKSDKKCFRYQNQDNAPQLGCIDKIPEICDNDKDHCFQCEENLCNAEELAECFECTDCLTVDDVETILCANPADQCFTVRKDKGEVIRGCTSDYNGEELKDDEICPGAACNSDIIGKSCYQCKNCTELQDLSPKVCIQSFKGCYTVQDLKDQTIDRGCVSDSGFTSCKENINCFICVDEVCNTHEVKPNPLLCSSCLGKNCSNYTPAEQCGNNEDLLINLCVTISVANVTLFKGCLSDGIPEDLEIFCYTPQQSCELCDEDYCNTPDLSCFSCSTDKDGIECITNPIDLSYCKANEVCVTYMDDAGHLNRGCSTDQEGICIEGPLCKQCKDHNCNVQLLPENRISCYQCDGDGCEASKLQPSDSKPCLVYGEDQFCYTYAQDNITVTRGCSNDKLALVCDSEPCVPCHDKHCNSQDTVQANQLSCIQCPSNSACEGQAFGTMCTKEQLLGRSDQCYTLYFKDLIIEKGCLSELPIDHLYYEDCLIEDPRCTICSENDCNFGAALCYKCNSNEDNDCSELVSTSQYQFECQTECLTLVDAHGYTKRGCVEDFPDACENISQCDTCQGKLCNDKILPEHRQRCYVCQGSKLECLNPIPGLVKACVVYTPDDKCYTRFENSTWVERDCLSSIEEETCEDECVKCPNMGCNDYKAYESNLLSCVTCEGETCRGIVDGQQCSKQLLLGRQDSCYEYTDGDMVSKGCLSDLDEDSEIKEECVNSLEGLCRLCSHDDCNGDIFNCVSCDSSTNPECGEWMKPVSPDMLVICEGRRCVSYVDDKGFTQKGCSTETTACVQGDATCYECHESMCNNAAFPEDRILCYQCEECNYLTPTDRPVACSKYSPDESCYTYVIGDSIYRGCLMDTVLECTERCLTCNSSSCNDHPYEFNSSLSCIKCSGARDCQEKSETELCVGTLNLSSTDQCYSLLVNDEIIEKGCQRAFPECSDLVDCTLCSCDGCNLYSTDPDIISCIECEGEDCGNELDARELCEDVACISYVSKEGIVSRGCLSGFENLCSSYGNKHETCSEPVCNKNIFPSDRIKCYRCDDCETMLGSPEICAKYVEGDGCFTAISDDGSTVSRGCISELKTICTGALCTPCYETGCNGENQPDQSTTEAPGSTSTSTEDSSITTEEGSSTSEASTSTNDASTSTVNSVETTTTTSSLACIRCKESMDVTCAWGFQSDSAEQCPTDSETGCFTCKQEDNSIVRGCSSEQGQNTCSATSIEECAEAGCNNENQLTQQCAICESNCDGPNVSYRVEKCEGIVEYANRGCYLIRNERRIVTERGCVSELDAEKKQNSNRKRFKKPRYPAVDEALYVWFLQKRQLNVPVSHEMLQVQAQKFYSQMIGEGEYGSRGTEELRTDDGAIFCKFLPPNTTAVIQPMDQHVIQMVKARYKKIMTNEILGRGDDFHDNVKRINIKDAMYWIAQAWEAVPESAIQKSWKILHTETPGDDEDDLPLSVLQERLRNIMNNIN
ncbi:uncharacterized protein LOC135697001 [Ochlerotatus camptorhynchus]|uniref:uncharacterized protein LOC135697001 n=1 Tax=Ochlerotatus camptorhynchus TaxID=644619 RepID=UPI0031E095DC